MREMNALHIRSTGVGVFDIEIFPMATYSTIEERDLTAVQVVERLLSGPETIEIHSFDAEGQPTFHQSIQDELLKRDKTFKSFQSCIRCNDSKVVNGEPCPSCAVPWK